MRKPILSDEGISPKQPETPEIKFYHCDHPGCQMQGSLGYDRGGGRTDRWCFEHVPRDANGERVRSY